MNKPLGLKQAIACMQRPGTRLVKMVSVDAPEGYAYYVIPGGPVEPDVAAKIKDRPDVEAGKDGLCPDLDQTWRISTHKEVK